MKKMPYTGMFVILSFSLAGILQLRGQRTLPYDNLNLQRLTSLNFSDKKIEEKNQKALGEAKRISVPSDSSHKKPVGRKINLATEAKLTASHHTTEWVVENAVDNISTTQWVGEDQPLTSQPTNIIIDFKSPKTVQRLVLVTAKAHDVFGLKDFEVYGWAKNGWAGQTPLAVVKNTNQERTIVDFDPVKTKSLRIRIRDTWYQNIFPRLVEIEAYEALPGSKLVKLEDSPIPDEKKSEQMILDRAYGRVLHFPRTTFNPSLGYLYYTTTFADTMIAAGTDRYGAIKSPMFASLLDMESHRNPEDVPGHSPGQRYGDRSTKGGNLCQDVMLLQAMDNMTRMTGKEKYHQAVTDYLTFFLANCPHPNTGLFPWGEHAYWNFYEEKNTYNIHEFLGGVPYSFWERIWGINPKALINESNGLINHVKEFDNFYFDRHADITTPMPIPRSDKYGGLDFARHAGFYIHLWTFAYSKTKDPKYMAYAEKMFEHHWNLRSKTLGLPPNTKGAKFASAASTLALSLSLLEAAQLLPQGDKMRERYETAAKTYMEGILRLPHKPASGQFLVTAPMDAATPETATGGDYGESYKYGYGGGFSGDYAGLLVGIYRLSKDQRALNLANDFADFYSKNNPPPITDPVYARVYSSIIGLFNDLYEIEHKPQYLQQAKRYAKYAIENLFYNGMFRGATNINHYEGDMMESCLTYNLVWLQALDKNLDIKIEPNYFTR